MKKKTDVLAFIPAREHSKRIPHKNIRKFAGKPLLVHTIDDALHSRRIDRTVVCTESSRIARMAKGAGAEVVIRPQSMGSDTSDVMQSILFTLARLKKEEAYVPTHIVILQATSPLREEHDIENCFRLMEKTGATTVLTVAPTHPKLYHLSPKGDLQLVNGSEKKTSRTQAWPKGYLLNGCVVYVVKTSALLKEKRVITKHSKAVIMEKWRSVDLDEPEEWAMAELLYKNKKWMRERIHEMSHARSQYGT